MYLSDEELAKQRAHWQKLAAELGLPLESESASPVKEAAPICQPEAMPATPAAVAHVSTADPSSRQSANTATGTVTGRVEIPTVSASAASPPAGPDAEQETRRQERHRRRRRGGQRRRPEEATTPADEVAASSAVSAHTEGPADGPATPAEAAEKVGPTGRKSRRRRSRRRERSRPVAEQNSTEGARPSAVASPSVHTGPPGDAPEDQGRSEQQSSVPAETLATETDEDADMTVDWKNIPSWQELVASLYRPER